MGPFEQENLKLREKVAALQDEVEKLRALIASSAGVQNQSSPSNTPTRTIASTHPISTVFATTPQHTIVEGFLWNMTSNPDGVLHPHVTEVPKLTTQCTVPIPQVGMTYSAPVIHVVPQEVKSVSPAENVITSDQENELQQMFVELKQEIEAHREKRLFGKSVRGLCLIPNLVIPPKFKVPNFEKYKGDTCPKNHMTRYVRKMSALTNDDQLLIHFFQESLTGDASDWYVGLDSADIRTFTDLREAFLQQYGFNLYKAPSREQLRALSQENNETFQEYARRWRLFATRVSPPMEEDEIIEIFLKSLDDFYFEKMVASASNDFVSIVNVGIRIEEAIRVGRLTKESVSADYTKKKDPEVSVVQQRPRQQAPRQSTPQDQVQKASQYDIIPMKYADLLPILFDHDLVQTRPPPPVLKKLPKKWRHDRYCTFHQGAQGHDLEHCFSLKMEVQKLIEDDILTFTDSYPYVQVNLPPNHGVRY